MARRDERLKQITPREACAAVLVEAAVLDAAQFIRSGGYEPPEPGEYDAIAQVATRAALATMAAAPDLEYLAAITDEDLAETATFVGRHAVVTILGPPPVSA